jgi:hypothetical protein
MAEGEAERGSQPDEPACGAYPIQAGEFRIRCVQTPENGGQHTMEAGGSEKGGGVFAAQPNGRRLARGSRVGQEDEPGEDGAAERMVTVG